MYESSEEIDFTFAAISADPVMMQDSDFVFMTLKDPAAKLIQGGHLPAISGMLPINEEHSSPRHYQL